MAGAFLMLFLILQIKSSQIKENHFQEKLGNGFSILSYTFHCVSYRCLKNAIGEQTSRKNDSKNPLR